MKTKEMVYKLMHFFGYSRNYVVENLTVNSGLVDFETDLLVVTKSGFAHAIEIKVSNSDLKKDLQKKHIKNLDKIVGYNNQYGSEYYYASLKYFSYAVPVSLEKKALSQIPSFCGLIVVEKGKKPFISREPKKINNYKWSQNEIFNLLRIGTMRIINNYKQ